MTPTWEQAARVGDADSLSAQLCVGADVNALDRYGQSALMLACLAGSLEAVKVLVRSEAENFSSSVPSELLNDTLTNWAVTRRNFGTESSNLLNY